MSSSLPPKPPRSPHGSVADTLRTLPSGVQPSDVWRSAAFALLRLNPRECDAVAAVFEDDSVTDETRGLVLDLLAGAGSFEAQIVIRRLLSLAIARRSSRTFATWVQTLGFVERPDGPTLRFLMSVYAESRNESSDVRAACAYALGAAAGHALADGDVDAAVRASDVLRRELLGAISAQDKCALLTALGNAGVPADVAALKRFAQDREPAVRCAAALALRKMVVADARAHLVAMLADRDPNVAQSAVIALGDHKLDDEELERLAELVLGGRSSLAIDARLLRLIVAQRPRLTATSGRTGAVESALRLLLGRVEAAGANEAKVLVGSGERRMSSGPSFPAVRSSSVPPPAARSPSVPPPAPLAPSVPRPASAALAQTVFGPVAARLPKTAGASPSPVTSGAYRIVNDDAMPRKKPFDPDATIANDPPKRISR